MLVGKWLHLDWVRACRDGCDLARIASEKYVTDPRSFNPISAMPPQPTFDDKTFNALEAYFKAMMPIE